MGLYSRRSSDSLGSVFGGALTDLFDFLSSFGGRQTCRLRVSVSVYVREVKWQSRRQIRSSVLEGCAFFLCARPLNYIPLYTFIVDMMRGSTLRDSPDALEKKE